MRVAYALLTFAFRVGRVDSNVSAFGLDITFSSYRGLVESMRLKNDLDHLSFGVGTRP